MRRIASPAMVAWDVNRVGKGGCTSLRPRCIGAKETCRIGAFESNIRAFSVHVVCCPFIN